MHFDLEAIHLYLELPDKLAKVNHLVLESIES